MRPSNPLLKRSIIWIISLVIALMMAMVVDSQIPSFWNYDRKIRYAIYLLSIIICAYLFTWVLDYSIHLLKTKPRPMIIFYLGLTIGISLLLPLMGIKLQSSMPDFVFQGNLVGINRTINLVMPFVVLPYMFMIFLVSAISRLVAQLSRQVGNKSGNVDLMIMNYPKIFIFTFLVITLLPLIRGTELNNIEHTFWGRGWLIKMYSGLMVKMGNEVYDNSLITRDNWLIYGGDNSIDDFQNTIPFTDQELETIQQKLDSLSERLAAKGIKLLVTIPPNKNTIYPEYLPPEIPIIGDQSRLDQLINYEAHSGEIKILDLRPALMAERSHNLVYYRTDTHWNSLGAFIAYQVIMKELHNWYPDLVAHTISDYQIVARDYPGDIGQKMIKYDFIENAGFLKPLYKRKYDLSTIPSGLPDQPNLKTTVQDTNLPSLLMVGDSFVYGLQPFLSEHFSRALYIWSFPNNDSYYDTEKPDIVIIEITERKISGLLQIPE